MRAPITDKHLLEMMWERFPEIMQRGAEQPAPVQQEPDELRHIGEQDCLLDVDEKAWRSLVENRGGCRCHISPPCGACSNPISEEEMNEVGYTYTSPKPALAEQPAQLPFGVGGGLVAIKTLLSRDPCVHANTAIQMIDAILAEQPAQQEPEEGNWIEVQARWGKRFVEMPNPLLGGNHIARFYFEPAQQEPVAVPDCGEAGHDDGACGNRECLPSFRRSTTSPPAHPHGWQVEEVEDGFRVTAPDGERWRFRETDGIDLFVFKFFRAICKENT